MNMIYFGKYNQRFKIVTNLLNSKKDKTIVELCFGDILIANWCRLNNLVWIGFDINDEFIKNARSKGFNAQYKDILKFEALPKSDVVILMGSLYQFNTRLNDLISSIMKSTNKLIISEPIINLASQNNIVGYFAKRLTKVGKGNEIFRYDYGNLHHALKDVCSDKFKISEIKRTKKDLILVIQKL